jgi:hypothetical protein
VKLAIDGDITPGSDLSLATTESNSLADMVTTHRAWLGLKSAPVIRLPAAISRPVSWVADALGRLGWRSPLRSTAIAVMQSGVTSRHSDLPFEPESVSAYLARHPAGVQDIWFARLYLLKPLIFFVLSAFWIVSGLVPLLQLEEAAAHLQPVAGAALANILTIVTSLLDIALGAALVYRPYAAKALYGMAAVTLAYIAGSILVEPAIWLDPLGPMVKTIPAFALTLAALAIVEER